MAVVVDTNVVSSVLGYKCSHPILKRWLFTHPDGKLALRRDLLKEYGGTAVAAVTELGRNGRVKWADEELCKADDRRIARLDHKSDDPHILSLIRVCAARLLCSDDGNLRDDARNRTICNPPVKLYVEVNRQQAQRLLREYGPCGNP